MGVGGWGGGDKCLTLRLLFFSLKYFPVRNSEEKKEKEKQSVTVLVFVTVIYLANFCPTPTPVQLFSISVMFVKAVIMLFVLLFLCLGDGKES